MEIHSLRCGRYKTNIYLLQEGSHYLLIDPGCDEEAIINEINQRIGKGKLAGVIYTHHHFDHIGGGYRFNDVPHYMAQEDIDDMRTFNQHYSHIALHLTYPEDLKPLQDRMQIGPFSFDTIRTPGHTRGSVCLDFGTDLFTGDTLFKEAHGRTDLDFGDEEAMHESLKRLATLPDKRIYPGHGRSSTLAAETAQLQRE